MSYLHSIILGIIEGITEFLPISSTGHMVIASSIMGINESDFTKAFEVIIQFGAILSVLVLYWRRFLPNWGFYKKLFVAFLPTAIIGFAAKHVVDQLLESVQVVAWSLILGGFVLVWSDKIFAHLTAVGRKTSDLTYKDSVKLGLFQSIAMIPGVSRSGATIMGGLFLGMQKKEAAEFSFFLAVPTMAAATLYKLLKIYKTIQPEQIGILAMGTFVSFVVAMLAIKFFMGIVTKYGFRGFGYYRIVLGVVILVLIYSGHQLHLG
ncbi:undecaprenyl-diphosphate phosphatase [Bdellovibrio svalbardensis]|uniref:Undecaprenyl-diphosphatase n=1 Tax=Bdellovibrio svalbardensis TaxID=2972972 RepID=A0ABT6DGD7_9BACT|nr:undecaprenyl-diphosphate phosphatase [Bdellovibrio svalbardensis]MDG0815924.1 undecaprenyl-diphosphate phosphatase [Bdellovibrio svalbardensis]